MTKSKPITVNADKIEEIPFEDIGKEQQNNTGPTLDVYKVKPNLRLFNQVGLMNDRLRELASIIQNDQTVTKDDIKNTNFLLRLFKSDLDAWWLDVLNHIDNCNP